LVDSEGRILDGNERSETFENWPKRTLENIRTDEQRLLLEVHLNLARRSDRNYNKGLVNKLAQFYLDGGARIRGEVKGRRRENEVMALTIEAFRGALNARSVLRLLDDRFKQNPRTKSKRGETPDYAAILEERGPIGALKFVYGAAITGKWGKGFWDMLRDSFFNGARAEIRAELEVEAKKKMKSFEAEVLDEMKAFKAKVLGKRNVLQEAFFQELKAGNRWTRRLRKEIREEIEFEMEAKALNVENLLIYYRDDLVSGEVAKLPRASRRSLFEAGILQRHNISKAAHLTDFGRAELGLDIVTLAKV